MEDSETVEVEVKKVELKHEFGKLMIGSIAAYAAEKLTSKAYDKVLYTIRARKVR